MASSSSPSRRSGDDGSGEGRGGSGAATDASLGDLLRQTGRYLAALNQGADSEDPEYEWRKLSDIMHSVAGALAVRCCHARFSS